MALSKEANERMWDALLREALIDSCNDELARIEAEMEKEQDIGDFSKEITRKIKSIANSIGRREHLRSAGKILRKTIVAAALVISIMSGALLTQPDVYAAVGGVIRKVFDTHDSIEFQAEKTGLINNNIKLGYIPDGYKLRYGEYYDYDVSLTYTSAESNDIIFDYGIAQNLQMLIDNENRNYKEINNKGKNYLFYEAESEDRFSLILWYDTQYYYCIYAQLEQEEFMKIAENISF